MSSTGSSGKPTTRRYTPEDKEQAVRMVRTLRAEIGTSQGTVKRVADQLGYGVESVRTWVREAAVDRGEAAGTTTEQAALGQDLGAGDPGVAARERDPAVGVDFYGSSAVPGGGTDTPVT